jgi:serine/threonine protein kinase
MDREISSTVESNQPAQEDLLNEIAADGEFWNLKRVDFNNWSHLSHHRDSQGSRSHDREHANYPKSIVAVILRAISRGAKIIDFDDLVFGNFIGKGASMTVSDGTYRSDLVALKVPRTELSNGPIKVIADVDSELRFLQSEYVRHHPNIVRLFGISWTEDSNLAQEAFLKPVLVMELACLQHRTLDELIPSPGFSEIGNKAFLISDIVNGLQAVYDEGFVHGDLKPQNILIFKEKRATGDRFVAKLSDFGYSNDVTTQSTAAGGTEYWASPEYIEHGDIEEKFDPKAESRDLYSLGLIIWYILTSSLPFGPDHGSDWAAHRDEVRELKLSDEIFDAAASFVDTRLQVQCVQLDVGRHVTDILLPRDPPASRQDLNEMTERLKCLLYELTSGKISSGAQVVLSRLIEEQLRENISSANFDSNSDAEEASSVKENSPTRFQRYVSWASSEVRYLTLNELLFRGVV